MAKKLGALIIDLSSTELSHEEKELIGHPLVGGVILFTRNYQDKKQLQALCIAIRKIKQSPILIVVDQEGGRVQRFKEGFTELPAFSHYGKLFENNSEAAKSLAAKFAFQMASELLEVGIDLSLSPVLDLNKGMNTVIGDRAFHRNHEIVTAIGDAFITGMRNAGMASVAKHFPGHGSVTSDSHHELPIDHRSLQAIETDDLLPFLALSSKLNGIMASHLLFPAVDKQIVGFSSTWLQNILRKKLNFKNTIFTDDLNMKAAAIAPLAVDRFMSAREAGCDFILYCNDRPAVIDILDDIPYQKHFVDEEKWQPLIGKKASNYDNCN